MADKGAGVKVFGLSDDGLTVKFLYEFTDDEARKEFEKKNNFWNFVEKLLRESDEVLANSEFPAVGFVVAHRGNEEWSYLPTDDEDRRERITAALPETSPSWAFTAQFADAYSNEFYAAVIGNRCLEVLSGKKKSERSDDFVSSVFLLGKLLADREWRQKHKPSIITGMKTLRNLGNARKNSIRALKGPKNERQKLVAMIAKASHLTGGGLVNRVQRLLRTEYGLRRSTRTIRRDLEQLRDAGIL